MSITWLLSWLLFVAGDAKMKENERVRRKTWKALIIMINQPFRNSTHYRRNKRKLVTATRLDKQEGNEWIEKDDTQKTSKN